MPGHTSQLPRVSVVTEHGKLPDPIEEHFAYLVASGASFTQAIKTADPDRPAPHNAGARMAKLPQVVARIKEIAGNAFQVTETRGIKSIDKRIAVIEKEWSDIQEIFECRSDEYIERYPDVAGGHTGYFCWEEKVPGSKWHHVDYKLLQESRELLRLVHEWDKRGQSLKALHLHQHQHAAKQDGLEEMLAKATPAQRQAIMEAFPVVAEALDTGESKA